LPNTGISPELSSDQNIVARYENILSAGHRHLFTTGEGDRVSLDELLAQLEKKPKKE
jgi:ethanolamine utilization protein EutP (predicted NTPase)